MAALGALMTAIHRLPAGLHAVYVLVAIWVAASFAHVATVQLVGARLLTAAMQYKVEVGCTIDLCFQVRMVWAHQSEVVRHPLHLLELV